MNWTVLIDLEADDEGLARARRALTEALEQTTGIRPRLRTIQTAQFELLLRPERVFQEVRPSVWNGTSGKARHSPGGRTSE